MAKPAFFIHQSSIADEPCTIGKRTKIWHFSHISSGAQIGTDCTIGQNVFIGGRAVVDNHVKIQNNVSIYDGVILEDYVFCGPSVVFTNVNKPRSKFPQRDQYQQTIIREGASLGANSTIVCGTTVGRHSFVGAGSVVTKDVPDHALVFGNPAAVRGWICECGTKLEFKKTDQVACRHCNSSYRLKDNQVTKIKTA